MAPGGWMRRRTLLATLRAVARRRTEILGYHGVSERSEHDLHNLLVAPAAFRAQIELLLEAGFEFVTVESLAAEVHAGEIAPGRIALSFDDGMEDNHHNVLPILREYGIPGTFYVATGLLGRANPFISGGARMMTVQELREIAAQGGVEIGAHTVTHPDLSTLGYDECLREMTENREALESLLGRPATTFAYPFCRYGPDAIAAARDAGFSVAVTCKPGSWAPFELGRSMISSLDSLGRVALKLTGIFEPIATCHRALTGGGAPRRQRPSDLPG
jgi:peptidoglycan/xylan/chitin deacetylase (PgdA/CDA1 family)